MMNRQRTARIALVAAASAAIAWTAKGVAIGLAGGLDLSPAEGPLFFLGLASILTASIFLMLTWFSGSRPGIRALAGIGGVLLGIGLALVTRSLVALTEPPSPAWPWSELNLWFSAALVLVVAVLTERRVGVGRAQSAPLEADPARL